MITNSRQMGKTLLDKLYLDMSTNFTILNQTQIDGATWYTVSCTRKVSIWLCEQPKELQKSHNRPEWFVFFKNFDKNFDIHEKLYSMMLLKWS